MKQSIVIILLLIGSFAYSQTDVFKGDPDRAFEAARELAFNKKRKQAQDTLLLILTKYPDYHDIRSFLGTTYSWDGEYKKARKAFDYVLKRSPERLDTWIASIKNELYAGAPIEAMEKANTALKYFPDDAELLYLKASAQEAANNPEDALITIESNLALHPDHEKSQVYRTNLRNRLSLNTIGLRSAVDLYSERFDPMQYYTLRYGKATKYGSIQAKLNFNRRFASNGLQAEIDLYPRITTGLYAYANFGYSDSFLFPDIRYGAELYKTLPKSFEISAGFRALKFQTTTTIYTSSIGWYNKNNYWALRGYLTPGEPKASMSGILTFRHYRSDVNNYFSIDAGAGFSPEENRFNFNNDQNAIVKLLSQKLNFGYYFSSGNKQNLWGLQAGVTHQEDNLNYGSYFWIYSFSLSWDLMFK